MDRLSLSSHGHDAASSARASFYVTSDRKEIGRACTQQTGSIRAKNSLYPYRWVVVHL